MARSKEIKHLQSLEVAHRSAAAPSIPVNYIIPSNYNDRTSNGLTKCIIAWLKYNHWQAERISNTGRLVSSVKRTTTPIGDVLKQGMKFIPSSGTNGTSDISATIQGRSVKIEVKIGSDIQSDLQKKYQFLIEQSGGLYYVAKDFTSFYNWYYEAFGRQLDGRI